MTLQEEIAKRGARAVDYLTEYSEKWILPKEPLRTASLHYFYGGGKGFRPAMLQLVCGALGGDENMAISPAAAIEAVHVSSLLHDDYMDQDETRRGIPAVWKKWNPTVAILAGDVLIGVAFTLVGDLNVTPELKYALSTELGQIYVRLCEGQMRDIAFETTSFNDITLEAVKKMQYLKTGVLFEFSCVTGARIALNKIEDPKIDLIRKYAKLAGTAFQIQDDLIGLLGKTEETGKPVGADIRVGKKTLIAVHAAENANQSQKSRLLEILGKHDGSDNEVHECLEIMKEIGSIDYAKSTALEMAKEAVELTKELPQNEQTKLLAAFAEYMVNRSY